MTQYQCLLRPITETGVHDIAGAGAFKHHHLTAKLAKKARQIGSEPVNSSLVVGRSFVLDKGTQHASHCFLAFR